MRHGKKGEGDARILNDRSGIRGGTRNAGERQKGDAVNKSKKISTEGTMVRR